MALKLKLQIAEESREKMPWFLKLGDSLRSLRLNFMFFNIHCIHLLLGFENFAKKHDVADMQYTYSKIKNSSRIGDEHNNKG